MLHKFQLFKITSHDLHRFIVLTMMRANKFPCRRHIGPLIGHGISLRVIRRRLIVACSRSGVLTRRIRPLDPNQSLVNAIGWVG